MWWSRGRAGSLRVFFLQSANLVYYSSIQVVKAFWHVVDNLSHIPAVDIFEFLDNEGDPQERALGLLVEDFLNVFLRRIVLTSTFSWL